MEEQLKVIKMFSALPIYCDILSPVTSLSHSIKMLIVNNTAGSLYSREG